MVNWTSYQSRRYRRTSACLQALVPLALLPRAHSRSLTLYPHPPLNDPFSKKKSRRHAENLRALRNNHPLFPFLFLFFRQIRADSCDARRSRGGKIDVLAPSPATHLLLDDKERVLQRHSSIRSVFEFKAWAAACLAATAARHPRWKRARASAARSSVGRDSRARPEVPFEERRARWGLR